MPRLRPARIMTMTRKYEVGVNGGIDVYEEGEQVKIAHAVRASGVIDILTGTLLRVRDGIAVVRCLCDDIEEPVENLEKLNIDSREQGVSITKGRYEMATWRDFYIEPRFRNYRPPDFMEFRYAGPVFDVVKRKWVNISSVRREALSAGVMDLTNYRLAGELGAPKNSFYEASPRSWVWIASMAFSKGGIITRLADTDSPDTTNASPLDGGCLVSALKWGLSVDAIHADDVTSAVEFLKRVGVDSPDNRYPRPVHAKRHHCGAFNCPGHKNKGQRCGDVREDYVEQESSELYKPALCPVCGLEGCMCPRDDTHATRRRFSAPKQHPFGASLAALINTAKNNDLVDEYVALRRVMDEFERKTESTFSSYYYAKWVRNGKRVM